MDRTEMYYSVDIETAGPYPADFALLSIGACAAGDLKTYFYSELCPDRAGADPESMKIHGLSIERLLTNGNPPERAMRAFESWIEENTPANCRPVFVALNAAFDWMFVNDYFHRYLGRNPFGHFALDIKALYMGLKRIDSPGRVMGMIDRDYPRDNPLTHNALQDAIDQARLFNQIMDEIRAS
jgi:DNA polymerase III epsilon subunit-like protein